MNGQVNEEKRKVNRVEDQLYFAGLILLPIGLSCAYIVTEWVVPRLPPSAECILWKFFGFYCPGCGGTRAVISLLHGRFLASLWYHPIVMYVVVMYACFMISHTLEKIHCPIIKGMKFHTWILYAMPVILAINVILKNVLLFCYGVTM